METTPDGLPIDETAVRDAARSVLLDHWRPEGYTMPNAGIYPWQWLWDSCFHSIVWAELGDVDRALSELRAVFSFQTPSGFVPHMNYLPDPAAAEPFWGRSGSSTITQPPMYGHVVAELSRRGIDVEASLVDAAIAGVRFLLRSRRRSAEGLVELCHPWESGCDDSARWDDALEGSWTRDRWREHKHALLSTIEVDDHGAAVANDGFSAASVGFNALVAFNGLELVEASGDQRLAAEVTELTDALLARWDPALRTWVDGGPLAGGSGRVRTTDALLPLLVDDDLGRCAAVQAELFDNAAYGASCGPAGIHREEPTREPLSYWRGSAWPQLSYLLMIGCRRRGERAAAARIHAALRRGAIRSGWSEYWDPDTGSGGGACPQSWATLAALPTP